MEILLIVLAMAACCGLPLLFGGRGGSKGHSGNRDQSLRQEPEQKKERKMIGRSAMNRDAGLRK